MKPNNERTPADELNAEISAAVKAEAKRMREGLPNDYYTLRELKMPDGTVRVESLAHREQREKREQAASIEERRKAKTFAEKHDAEARKIKVVRQHEIEGLQLLPKHYRGH